VRVVGFIIGLVVMVYVIKQIIAAGKDRFG
jgi:hypothetical protein